MTHFIAHFVIWLSNVVGESNILQYASAHHVYMCHCRWTTFLFCGVSRSRFCIPATGHTVPALTASYVKRGRLYWRYVTSIILLRWRKSEFVVMVRRMYRGWQHLIIFARKYPPSKSCMICSAGWKYQKLSNARDVTSRLKIFDIFWKCRCGGPASKYYYLT